METTDKISKTIHQIFKIINVVYDPTVITFDEQQLIIGKLKHALDLASQIDISNVGQEVWDASSDIMKYEEIVDIVNERFGLLLKWKPNLYEISKLKESLIRDLSSYFEKTHSLGIVIIPQNKNKITELYIQIGLRFLKLNLDLDKIMDELQKKSEILEKKDFEKMFKAAGYNVKLAPNKVKDFTHIIFKLFYDDFFSPLDNKTVITEIDVLIAFQRFFDVEIIGTDNFSIDFYNLDNEIFKSNVVIENPLEIASNNDTGLQLKSFFTNAANNYFIENLPVEFKIEIGKSIAILIYVLKNYEPCLLTIPYRKAKMFHNSLKEHFKRDIGSYQSIFNYKVDPTYDREEIDFFNKRINSHFAFSNAH